MKNHCQSTTNQVSRSDEAETQNCRWLAPGVTVALIGLAVSLAGCALALPKHTVTENSYSSIANNQTNETTEASHVVFVRRSAFIKIPYQLYDGEKMISAGNGSDLCHVYETSPGMHALGLSFIAGTGTAGEIPRLRFKFIEADLAPGKVYYVNINIGDTFVGGFVGGLEPVLPGSDEEEELPEWLATCKLVEFDVATENKEWVERYSADFKPMFNEAFREWRNQVDKVRLSPEDGFDGFVAAAASR